MATATSSLALSSDLKGRMDAEAEDVIGYGGLAQYRDKLRMVRGLALAGVTPYPSTWVSQYMQCAVDASTTATYKIHWYVEERIFRFLAAAAGLGCSVPFFTLDTVSWWAPVLSGIAGFIVMFGFIVAIDSSNHEWPGRWRKVPTREYKQQIPQVVLQMMVDVKTALPEAEFAVQEFGYGLLAGERACEWILEAKYKDCRAHIAMWDRSSLEMEEY